MSQRFHPFPYQKQGIRFIEKHTACALFLPCGAGKSAITLSAICNLRREGQARRVLITAPKCVIETSWVDEIDKWSHTAGLTKKVLTPPDIKKKDLGDAVLTLVSRDSLPSLVKALDGQMPYDMIVLDELSGFKNSLSKRWHAANTLCQAADRVVGLTGTPAPKGYVDLWAQIYLLDEGFRLGGCLEQFKYQWLYPTEFYNDRPTKWDMTPAKKERFDRDLEPIVMSIPRQKLQGLPPINIIDVAAALPSGAQKSYGKLKKNGFATINGSYIEACDREVLVGKLKQVASGQIYDDECGKRVVRKIHTAKKKALEGILEGTGGEHAIVFVWYNHEIDVVLDVCEKLGKKAVICMGEASIHAWNRGEIDVLICQPKSSAYGLNLQAGGHIAIWYTLPNFDSELYHQGNARIWRTGQKDPVTIYRIIAPGTIDEQELAVIEQRQDMQQALIESISEKNSTCDIAA